jgi:uroporphyrinogen-III synthase
LEKGCRVLYLGPELPLDLKDFEFIYWLKTIDLVPIHNALKAAADYIVSGQYDCVAFMSPRAPRLLRPYISSWPAGVKAFAVGSSTATSIKETLNIEADYPRSYGSRELGELMSMKCRRVLTLRSENGDLELENTLRSHGVEVLRVDIYREAPANLSQQKLASHFDIIIISSAGIARAACDLLRPYAKDSLVIAIGPKTFSEVSRRCPEVRVIAPTQHTFNAISNILRALGCK